MKVTVLYFARVAELTGCQDQQLELTPGATAGEALAEVARRYPALDKPGFSPLLAVNREHAEASRVLADGDEVAIFPPVSGG
ncbi:MAG: molybdopterin converting factor subunit 1 [Acidobacteria bacterium]|nr:molybdopterin converting factor subunit 1 [Acidobacteriota bacterium]